MPKWYGLQGLIIIHCWLAAGYLILSAAAPLYISACCAAVVLMWLRTFFGLTQ
jgi:hypothetical protein